MTGVKCTDRKRKMRQRRKLILLMRRILFLLCISLFASIVFKYFSKEKFLAEEYETTHYNTAYHSVDMYASELCVPDKDTQNELSGASNLKAYGLFDVTNTVSPYSYNVYDKIYPASTTKILTALVAMENADLSETVTVSKNASSDSFAWDEQTCGIKEGDTLSLESLLYGLLLYSGNDTAVAIAEHVGGTVEDFAVMMNDKAKELMATNSNFMNPSGLYDDDHYTTAYDLYLIFNECIKHEEFVNIINTKKYDADITGADSSTRTLTWEPTNYYALGTAKSPDHVTVVGGKTGTLKAAGNCLILMANDEAGAPYISVVMGAESKDLLYQDMTSLLAQISKSE